MQRDDDKAETVSKRLSVYHDQTEPLIKWYEDRACCAASTAPVRPTRCTTASVPHWLRSDSRQSFSDPQEDSRRSRRWRRRAGARPLPRGAARRRAPATTAELDEAAERFIRSQGAEPAFKGYRGFPGSICASPNSMVVHGIPGSYRLNRGDILTVDIGVILDGWVADAAITHPIGNVTPVAQKLLATTKASLFDAVEQCVPGNRLGDVSHAVQTRVESDGFSVIRSLVGHGIGRDMHEDPQIELRRPGTGPELEEGMVLAIEPMVNVGTHHVRMGSDNWAVYSRTARWPPISSTLWPLRGTVRASSHLAPDRVGSSPGCYSFRSARRGVSWAPAPILVVSDTFPGSTEL